MLVAILVTDSTIVGAAKTRENAVALIKTVCALSTPPRRLVLRTYDVATPRLAAEIARLVRETCATRRLPVLLYVNGHSKLWSAQERGPLVGDVAVLGAEYSAIVSGASETPVLDPVSMRHILETASAACSRCLVFLDTCHSMSLVTSVTVPAGNIRVVHGSGQDERAWQTREGSVISHVWRCATRTLLEQRDRGVRPIAPFHAATQLVSRALGMPVLESGPGQGLTFFD